jgi:hypothetical protein
VERCQRNRSNESNSPTHPELLNDSLGGVEGEPKETATTKSRNADALDMKTMNEEILKFGFFFLKNGMMYEEENRGERKGKWSYN